MSLLHEDFSNSGAIKELLWNIYKRTICPWIRGLSWCDMTLYLLTFHTNPLQTQDVGDGLQYLHRLKVIHGDLKPVSTRALKLRKLTLCQTNVLVDDDGVAKLCDFGLVRLADWEGPAGMTTTSVYSGTERYKAPELFVSAENRHPRASFEGDIYSLGCIMLEVCT
jgi:serine/threonine protein kinase